MAQQQTYTTKSYDDDEPTFGAVAKFIALCVAGAIFAIVGLTVLFGSWYTVDATQRAVLLTNGAFSDVMQPGIHFKWPWVQAVYKIDMQTHTKTYGHDEKTNTSVMEAYSADQQPAGLRVSVTLHVNPDKVAEMYTRFGGDYEAAVSRIIAPHVYERVKVVFGQYTAASAISKRGQLNSDAARSIADAISYDPVFAIESAQIEDITFSADYIKSVEARMQAEVEVQRQQQNLAQEKIKADIAVTQANGRANSQLAEATANAKAITLKGEAEATAISARSKALGENPAIIELTRAERWDGKLPTTMVPQGAVPFMGIK